MPKRPTRSPSAKDKKAPPPAKKVPRLARARPLVRSVPVRVAPLIVEPAPRLEPEVRSVPVEIDPSRLELGVKKVGAEIAHWVKKGRYTKVRIKLRNTPILPDIPVGVALAAEGLSFALLGPLQAVLGTLVGNTVLNVELISDALHNVNRGRELILAGELGPALAQFRQAIAIDRDCAPAHLHIGIALKLQGDRTGARLAFERASTLDPKGPTGLEAEKLLATLR